MGPRGSTKAWEALFRVLADLAEKCDGACAAVIDDGNGLWSRRLVRAALPRIEALTLALPPPFGPDAGAGAGKGRA